MEKPWKAIFQHELELRFHKAAPGHVAAHEQQGEKSYMVIPHTFYT
jgi:hypothetical protein